jgi:hypothetical protein
MTNLFEEQLKSIKIEIKKAPVVREFPDTPELAEFNEDEGLDEIVYLSGKFSEAVIPKELSETFRDLFCVGTPTALAFRLLNLIVDNSPGLVRVECELAFRMIVNNVHPEDIDPINPLEIN